MSDGVVTVGGGALLADVYDALAVRHRTLPAGTNPTVGITGLALGGGLGLLGRQYGLTSDHLRRVEIVLADGRVLVCSDRRHDDLFWALRGAGGGHYGVVTSLVFQTVPAPVSIAFRLGWSQHDAVDVLDTWQRWAPAAPYHVEASARVTVSGSGDRLPVVSVLGVIHGTESAAGRLLDEFVARVGAEPTSGFRKRLAYRDALRNLTGLGSIDGPRQRQGAPVMVSRSEYFRQPIPHEALANLLDLLAEGLRLGESRELNFTPWGGAYNRLPFDATAFVHREEQFMVESFAVIDQGRSSGVDLATTDVWLSRSWKSLRPWGSGRVYPNFPDPRLENWPEAYYGPNYARLVEVKRRYDPENAFRFPQSIGSTNASEGVHRD